MNFVSLRNESSIAATCWGNHGKSAKYYDTAGAGYVEFSIADGSCTTQGLLRVLYYDSKGDTEPEQIFAGDKRYDELLKELEGAGGSWGQPFKGSENFPDNPDDMS